MLPRGPFSGCFGTLVLGGGGALFFLEALFGAVVMMTHGR